MFRIFKHYVNGPSIILSIGETFFLFWLAIATYHVLQALDLNMHPGFGGPHATYMALFTTTGMACAGMYNRQHFISYTDIISRATVILPAILGLIIASLFIMESIAGTAALNGNYLFCFIVLTTFSIAFLLWRAAFIKVIDRTDVFKRRILILGSGNRAANIETLSRGHRHRTITILGYLRLGSPPGPTSAYPDCRRSNERREDYWVTSAELPEFCTKNNVEEVVVASAERRGVLPVADLLACKFQGIQVTEYASFWERESGQVDPDEISPSWMVFSESFGLGVVRGVVKRGFDIVVSSLVLILTLPITIPTAVLILLESRGPLFYRQERVGLHGKSFMVLKFRSMCTDAEKDGPVWAAKNDARVTRVGAFIRKVRIDEIPQVINVLRGDMAFVGPRPERPVFVKLLAEKIPYYNERHVVKPGITGWAQVNYPYGATEHDAKMKLSYDLYSIKNGSLFLDIITMMQTVKVVIWHDGAR
jgi:sugar transferase (PEP-CTERM system associated)